MAQILGITHLTTFQVQIKHGLKKKRRYFERSDISAGKIDLWIYEFSPVVRAP